MSEVTKERKYTFLPNTCVLVKSRWNVTPEEEKLASRMGLVWSDTPIADEFLLKYNPKKDWFQCTSCLRSGWARKRDVQEDLNRDSRMGRGR